MRSPSELPLQQRWPHGCVRAHPLARSRQSAAVLEAVKVRPGSFGASVEGWVPPDLDSLCARRRSRIAVGTEESLRRGQTEERTQEGRKKVK